MLQKVTACESHMQTNTKIDVGLMDQKETKGFSLNTKNHKKYEHVRQQKVIKSYQKAYQATVNTHCRFC